MKKSSTLKIASKLRELTSYCPVRENDTRWSSTFNMLDRFLKIQKELSGIVELLSLLPNHLEVALLSKAFIPLKKFNSITTMLQRDGMTFVKSREIFDLFLKDHPEFEHYIAADASIVENETFEAAVMQISRGEVLSEDHRRAALPLLQPAAEETPSNEDDLEDDDIIDHERSYSEELERKLKRQKRVTAKERPNVYMNLDMLPGTSVNCERLFSQAKFILSDTRKRTNPTLFEALLLLKVNASSWNVFSVGKAMGRTSEVNSQQHADNVGGDVMSDVDDFDNEFDYYDNSDEEDDDHSGACALTSSSVSPSSSVSLSMTS